MLDQSAFNNFDCSAGWKFGGEKKVSRSKILFETSPSSCHRSWRLNFSKTESRNPSTLGVYQRLRGKLRVHVKQLNLMRRCG